LVAQGYPLRRLTHLAILGAVAPEIALKSAPQKFSGARKETGVVKSSGALWPL
jgi:hypothetical protein